MSLRPGEVFAGYTVERELGAGGMGSVYLVRHPRLPRFDALKLLRPELCDDPNFVGRFEREADTVAQLDHPNIVAVHDRGSQDGQLWISMRFIDGTNAEKALADYEQGMPPERVVRIVSKVASALDYAHRHHLLHRDVKPANILLTGGPEDEDAERVFLSDFGVAKAIGEAAERISSLTSTGSVVATLDYASPEQIKGQVLDHRSDIYALGCVLYKLLTGTVPYPGDSVAARVYGHLNNQARPTSSLVPGLPTGFDEVVARAMAKEPDDRYPTCRALALAARVALTSEVGPTAPRPDPDEGFPTILTAAAAGLGTQSRPEQPMPPWLGSAPGPAPGSQPGSDSGRWPGSPPVAGPTGGAGPAPMGELNRANTGPSAVPPAAAAGVVAGQAGSTGPHTAREESGSGWNGPSGQWSGEQSPADRSGPPDRPAGPPTATGSQPGSGAGDGSARRRATLIAAGVAAVVVVAAVVTALVLKVNVAGTATLGAGTSPSASSTSPAPPSSVQQSSSAPPTSSTVRSSAAGSSAAPTSPPAPVPGLPHSTPLPGQVLLSTRDVNGSSDLYQVDAITGAVGQKLTSTGTLGPQFPILSPDRGSVVYVQTVPNAASTLRTMAIDGTGDRALFTTMPADCANFYRPAWNPATATDIALPCVTAAGSVAVHVMSVDGTEVGTVSTGLPVVDDLTYSPDGKTLAFWGSESQQVEGTIYTMPVDGSAPPTRLVEPIEGTSDADPSFSPDGSKIAFRRVFTDSAGKLTGAQLFVVGVDGSDPTAFTDGTSVDQDPIWSPDGTEIAFKSNRLNAAGTTDNQIWVIGADGSGLKELGIGSPGNANGAPAWGHR